MLVLMLFLVFSIFRLPSPEVSVQALFFNYRYCFGQFLEYFGITVTVLVAFGNNLVILLVTMV